MDGSVWEQGRLKKQKMFRRSVMMRERLYAVAWVGDLPALRWRRIDVLQGAGCLQGPCEVVEPRRGLRALLGEGVAPLRAERMSETSIESYWAGPPVRDRHASGRENRHTSPEPPGLWAA